MHGLMGNHCGNAFRITPHLENHKQTNHRNWSKKQVLEGHPTPPGESLMFTVRRRAGSRHRVDLLEMLVPGH